MASQIEIANMALLLLGARAITDIEDDAEADAVTLLTAWDIRRDACMRAHAWRFSIKRDNLAASLITPTWGFTYQYELPSDCLKVLQISQYYPGVSLSDYRASDEAYYRVEGNYILSYASDQLPIRFVSRVTETGSWDAGFVEFFAADLAETCCERITQSDTKRQLASAAKKAARLSALRSNAIEAPPEARPDSEWVAVRYTV